MSSDPTDRGELVDGFARDLTGTVVREHISLEDAVRLQHRLVDVAQQVMGSDVVFVEDYGQVRELATVGFGGGGRPRATARVEEVLARFFDAEDAVLIHGAGTGSIRAMLNGLVEPGSRIVVHEAHPYKTTLPAMRHMGLTVDYSSFDDAAGLEAYLREHRPASVYLQHVPQRLGDSHDVARVIDLVRSVCGNDVRILVDDNYAVMRSPRIGVQMGADASALSLFKLLSPHPIGAVLADRDSVGQIRRDLSSAGCQIQGPHAMAALRALVFAPVALAVQNQTVLDVAQAVTEGVGSEDYPFLAGAYAAQPGIRCAVLLFDRPVAEEFLRSAWRNGSPSQSVGEEAQFEFLPLFTYLTSTFLKSAPGLERYAVRVNPMRGGAETVLRILRAALADPEFRSAAASA
ncbi:MULTISPECIES: aminotransferase class V-fold PLP-dependent enzyme [unclassified Nocardioides]|uniref:aminotransferase class V-fold PLP-dependent enzyme n=1 Tax=unclassified Nocardioides TaxID=2615069 RepID=UPI0009F06ECB|nr:MULTISPECIES: aminotransferase class V-fold PLP-dependent enzyme [unclassified Nocardioides]GAW48732.1 Cystathionine beta-lyase family protein involved in aluminum resistance [Nocardioides sp. PD653-B2]